MASDTRLNEANRTDDTSLYYYDECKMGLEKQCEQLQAQLQNLQNKLPAASSAGTLCGDDISSDGHISAPLTAIYTAKKKALHAQINLLKDTQPNVLPLNVQCQHEVLVHELKGNISQLNDLLSLVKTQAGEWEDRCIRERASLIEQGEIKTALEEKLNLQSEYSGDKHMQELKAQCTTLDNYQTDLMTKMGNFVKTHFPKPTEEDIKQLRSKKRIRMEIPDANKILAMQDILEMLINRCLDTPHDPYITIDDTFWPAYVELLRRFGIAIQHPDNASQIKVTPFHL